MLSDEHKATIRSGLKVLQDESFFLPEAQGDTLRFEISNALAALESETEWEPVPDGEELRLWQGKNHRQSNCYVVTRKIVAGRLLPDGYAVCRVKEKVAR